MILLLGSLFTFGKLGDPLPVFTIWAPSLPDNSRDFQECRGHLAWRAELIKHPVAPFLLVGLYIPC